MEKPVITEEQFQSVSRTLLDSLRKDRLYSSASTFLDRMASSVPPMVGIPSQLLGITNKDAAFQALVETQQIFSGVFRKLLEDSVDLQAEGPSALRWDQLETRVVPLGIDGNRIKIRFVLRWQTASGVLAFNSSTKWK